LAASIRRFLGRWNIFEHDFEIVSCVLKVGISSQGSAVFRNGFFLLLSRRPRISQVVMNFRFQRLFASVELGGFRKRRARFIVPAQFMQSGPSIVGHRGLWWELGGGFVKQRQRLLVVSPFIRGFCFRDLGVIFFEGARRSDGPPDDEPNHVFLRRNEGSTSIPSTSIDKPVAKYG
jgi:hypothetical protein